VVIGGLGLTSASALAVEPAPEAPVTSAPAEVKGSTAVLEGVVNPLETATVSWFFEYKAGAVCTGGSVTPVEGPEETEDRLVEVRVEGLTQDTEYTVCLVAENTAGERTPGAPETFTTIAPEPPADLQAKSVTARTATLHGVLNPKHVGEGGTYEFVYKQSESECAGGNEKTAPVPAGTATGVSPEAVQAPVGGLMPNLPYTFCLRAKNEAGEEALSAPVTFTTLAEAPTILGESVSGVEAQTATLEAEIVPEGAPTTYHFVYVEAAKYRPDCAECEDEPADAYALGASTAESESIGADDTAHAAEARIKGLQPGTTYHYRVVATNEVEGKTETAEGPDKTFTTNPTPGSEPAQNCPNKQLRAEQPFGTTLPDCRAYEMVSPADTEGQDATDSFVRGGVRASVSSEDPAIAYTSKGSFARPVGESEENQFLSRREPERDGWSTQSITPPQDPVVPGSDIAYEAMVFTPDLSEGITRTTAPLVEGAAGGKQAEEFALYLTNLSGGSYRYVGEGQSPLGASTDLGRVVFGEYGGVSEWMDGQVTPVGVANSGAGMTATVGSQTRSLSIGFNRDKDVWHAVSADGSRVVFTSPASEEEGIPQVYVRVNTGQKQSELGVDGDCVESAKACTIEVSASQKTDGSDPYGPKPARYWGASEDTGKIFFTSNTELTNDAYTGSEDNAANLYECELVVVAEVTKCDLRDLTGEAADSTGEGAAVRGVVQISEDGSYVYFVAEGVLEGEHGEVLHNGRGGEPAAKKDNLYVSHDGSLAFIATLGGTDRSDWENGEAFPEDEAGPIVNTAVVNPEGTRLAFISESSLTGYDNREARQGECHGKIGRTSKKETGECREVYLYDAETRGLVCASCDPTGARPTGPSSLSQPTYSFAGYRPRNLLEDGTLFFNSSDALVSQADDGRQNVYEYEDGQIHAISDVAGGYESFFLDASPDGRDVFFATADDLLPQDTSNNIAVWDARVDGGFPVAATAPSCDNADSCKPPESPQPALFGAPSSSTFSGPGNTTSGSPPIVKSKPKSSTRAQKLAQALRACKKKPKNKRASCQAQAKRKYGPTKAKKAVDKRRTH
jgi:hypothetical protein